MNSLGSGRFLYFAYGSNLHPQRLRERAPSAQAFVGSAALSSHDLRFHKLGRDGSAKCDARYTGEERHLTYGAVYSIDERHRNALDQAESRGVGYEARLVSLCAEQGRVRAWTYLARQEALVTGIKPFDWYLDYVLAGARYHGLPSDYVELLAQTDYCSDSDSERCSLNRAILEAL